MSRRRHLTREERKAPREYPPPACIECGTPAEIVTGKDIYPHRPEFWPRPFWRCRAAGCGAYVGCHPGTRAPLGTPAGPETRSARSKAHAAFDPLWKRKADRDEMSRGEARGRGYAWLAAQLGIERSAMHIGMLDKATAEKVEALCKAARRAAE